VTEQGSRWQQEEGPATEREGGQEVPGRFAITTLPGRRRSPGRYRLIKVALALVGVLTLGIIAYAEWLALRPVPDTTAAFRATASELLTATLAPYSPGVSAEGLTLTPPPTVTPTPQPTRTPVPLVTRTPRAKPTAASLPPTPTAGPVPRLLEPADGATPVDRAVFRWEWIGPPLAEKLAFDLRIWSAQEEQAGRPRRGAVAPIRETQVEVDLRYVPAIQEYGPGDYYWTVVVVEFSADGSLKVVGQWGEAWRFVYR